MTSGRTDANEALTSVREALLGITKDIEKIKDLIPQIKGILDGMLTEKYNLNEAMKKVHTASAIAGVPMFGGQASTNEALKRIEEKTNERNRQLAALRLTVTELQGTPGANLAELNGLTVQIASLNEQNRLAQEAQKLLVTHTMSKGGASARIIDVDIQTLQRALTAIQVQLSDLTAMNKLSKDAIRPELPVRVKVDVDKGNKGPAPAA